MSNSTTSLDFTPGPWKRSTVGHQGYGTLLVGADDESVAVVYGANVNQHSAGNIALITAAPQLLDALREARVFVAGELALTLVSLCICTGGVPDRSTLGTDDRLIVDNIDILLAQIDAALDAAGCGGDGT